MRKVLFVISCVFLLVSCNKKTEEQTEEQTEIEVEVNSGVDTYEKEPLYLVENDEPTPVESFLMSNIFDGTKLNYQLDEDGNLLTVEDYTFYLIETKFINNYYAITKDDNIHRVTFAGTRLFFIKTGDIYNDYIIKGLENANEGMYIFAKTELDTKTTINILKDRRQTVLKTGIAYVNNGDIIIDLLNKEQYNEVKNALVVISTSIRNSQEEENTKKISDYLWSKLGQHRTEYTVTDNFRIYYLN